jgi:iron complex outermembrane receptor protein
MHSRGHAWISVALIAGFGAGPLAAQTPQAPQEEVGSATLAEVVVTAQKRSENAQNVPIAVSSLSASELQSSGVIDTSQLTTVVPGLSLGVTTQNFEPRLRGIGTGSNGPGIENPVALYVDGVYYASQLMGLDDLTDVSQVTVLKGPQGTLFGRNATGGVIQMTTRDPSSAFGAELQSELDNFLTTRNFAYVTGGIGSDLAANVSVHYTTQGNGWGRNVFDGADTHKIDHDWGARSKWQFTPSDSTTLKLSLDYSDLSNSLGPNLRPFPGTLPFSPGYVPTSNVYDVDTYLTNHNQEKRGGGSITLDQDLGFAHLVNITAYRQYHFFTVFEPSATPVLGLDIPFVQDGKQFTEELQLISAPSTRFSWVAGAYYFSGHEILDPFVIHLYGPYNLGLSEIDINDSEATHSVAGFAQATAEVLPQTNLTVGIRYTHERRGLSGTETGFVGPTIPIGPIVPYTDAEIDASKATWRVALDHKLAQDVLAYVSYNRGFKSGGFNAFDTTNPPYNPEVLDAYEAGIKSEWLDRRVRVNSAAFFYNYTDIQVTRYTNTAVVYNGARAQLYGLDIDSAARVVAGLQLTAGLEWIHSQFTSFPNAQFSTPLPNGGVSVYSGDATGNRLPFTPSLMIDVGADYGIEVHGSRLNFNITSAYSGGYYSEPDNRLHQAAFDYLNAGISWASSDEKLNLRLWARNLLDKAVVAQFATGAPQGYSADFSNPPRTYGFTVKYAIGGAAH